MAKMSPKMNKAYGMAEKKESPAMKKTELKMGMKMMAKKSAPKKMGKKK